MPTTSTIFSANTFDVQFTDASTGTAAATSWTWDFGNGQTSTLQNPPAVTYSTGTYSVSLTTGNETIEDTNIKTNYIVVGADQTTQFDFKYQMGLPPATRNAMYGNGIFVLVNWLDTDVTSGTKSYASSDGGITWSTGTLPTGGPGVMCYGNGVFVMYSRAASNIPGVLSTSVDGITWTVRNSSVLNSINGLPGNSGFVFGNGLFVMIDAFSQSSATSPDGITWTVHYNGIPNIGSRMTYGNGMFVTSPYLDGQARNNSRYSTDGINWTTTTLPSSSNSWAGVYYGNGIFVIPNSSLHGFAKSTDGINWTFVSVSSNISNYWYPIAFGEGGIFSTGTFIAMNQTSPVAWRSTDFINWTPLTAERLISQWQSLIIGNGTAIATPLGWDPSDTGVYIYK